MIKHNWKRTLMNGTHVKKDNYENKNQKNDEFEKVKSETGQY